MPKRPNRAVLNLREAAHVLGKSPAYVSEHYRIVGDPLHEAVVRLGRSVMFSIAVMEKHYPINVTFEGGEPTAFKAIEVEVCAQPGCELALRNDRIRHPCVGCGKVFCSNHVEEMYFRGKSHDFCRGCASRLLPGLVEGRSAGEQTFALRGRAEDVFGQVGQMAEAEADARNGASLGSR